MSHTDHAASVEVAPEVCSVSEGCITCGDIAVPLTVVAIAGMDARCRDEQGREELVAVELVGAVAPGDRVLVHAGVAIELLRAEWPHARPAGSEG
ncbi:MAG: HypC/HybG/HupF family hydrogenase formation chaperone [Actinomycetota bacterium]|nr:HypC/HybG/HupF family hydrogenase formation chaperone [Actinomycetota bacterium]